MNLDRVFKKCYSLGSNCMVAQQLVFADKKMFTGPFDWMITPKLEFITEEFEIKCRNFFKPENMLKTALTYSEPYCLTIKDNYTDNLSVHDIKKHADYESQLLNLKKKFDSRMDALYRDLYEQTPIVLLRTLGEADDILALDRVLKHCFEHSNYLLIGVKDKETDSLEVEELNSEVMLVNMSVTTRDMAVGNLCDWIGNTEGWQKLISLINIESKNKPITFNFHQMKNNAKGKKIILWGLGAGFSYINYLFKRERIENYFVYDSNEAKAADIVQDRWILLEEITPGKYYIVITTLHFFAEIDNILVDKGFTRVADFMFLFGGLHSFFTH